jgi:hypothetical protein
MSAATQQGEKMMNRKRAGVHYNSRQVALGPAQPRGMPFYSASQKNPQKECQKKISGAKN